MKFELFNFLFSLPNCVFFHFRFINNLCEFVIINFYIQMYHTQKCLITK